jgi:hypothetical protein
MTFSDAESARAAFALGRVRYRCQECGKWHTSGSPRSRKCLERRAGHHNWVRVLGPLPPDPSVPPSLAFVYEYWCRVWPKRIPPFPDGCVLPGEWVLALEDCRGLRKVIEDELEAKCTEKMAEITRGWEQYDLVCAWIQELSSCGTPAEVVSVEYGVHPLLDPLYCIRAYTVRSAVPDPDGASVYRVTAENLATCVSDSLKGHSRPSWSLLSAPVYVEYGEGSFLTVFPGRVVSRWNLEQGRACNITVDGYLACVDRGGHPALVLLDERSGCLRRVVRQAREQCGLA